MQQVREKMHAYLKCNAAAKNSPGVSTLNFVCLIYRFILNDSSRGWIPCELSSRVWSARDPWTVGDKLTSHGVDGYEALGPAGTVGGHIYWVRLEFNRIENATTRVMSEAATVVREIIQNLDKELFNRSVNVAVPYID